MAADISIKMSLFPLTFAEVWSEESPEVQGIFTCPQGLGGIETNGSVCTQYSGMAFHRTPNIRHRQTGVEPLKGSNHRIPSAVKPTSGSYETLFFVFFVFPVQASRIICLHGCYFSCFPASRKFTSQYLTLKYLGSSHPTILEVPPLKFYKLQVSLNLDLLLPLTGKKYDQ